MEGCITLQPAAISEVTRTLGTDTETGLFVPLKLLDSSGADI